MSYLSIFHSLLGQNAVNTEHVGFCIPQVIRTAHMNSYAQQKNGQINKQTNICLPEGRELTSKYIWHSSNFHALYKKGKTFLAFT